MSETYKRVLYVCDKEIKKRKEQFQKYTSGRKDQNFINLIQKNLTVRKGLLIDVSNIKEISGELTERQKKVGMMTIVNLKILPEGSLRRFSNKIKLGDLPIVADKGKVAEVRLAMEKLGPEYRHYVQDFIKASSM